MFNHYYVGDFENTTGGDSTYVYGAGFMSLEDTDVSVFNNIDDAMNYLSQIPSKSCVYFHNFANYDGWIILDWLLNHGYVYSTDPKVRKRFTGIITDDRQIYQLKVRLNNKHAVEFRDTCKLVAGKLDKIGKNFKCPTAKLVGTINYDKPRVVGYIMDDIEVEYLKHDVMLLKEILEKILTMNGLSNYLTAGAFAFSEMKHCLYQDLHGLSDTTMEAKRLTKWYKKDLQNCYRTIFPEIDRNIDKRLRKAYRGGYCINWSDGEIYQGHGIVLDFNSLYPSVMVDKPYPYGEPIYFDGSQGIPNCDCFIVHIATRFKLKDGCLPFIQIKGSPYYVENEYLREMVQDEVDLWLTSVDYKLFHDMYDVLYEEVLDGYRFASVDTLFNNFVTSHYAMKANAPDKTTRQVAKIILNSSYGKFGTRIERFTGEPYINADAAVGLHLIASTDMPSATYIPVACFVTAYGREKTIRSAVKVIEHLRYIDTDSLHLVDITLDEVKKIFNIDDKALGALACESEFDQGRWVRQKTYVERNIIEDGQTLAEPHINIKACGLTDEGKEELLTHDDLFMEFTFGLTVKGCKLMKHTVQGGCNLHRVDFNIRG